MQYLILEYLQENVCHSIGACVEKIDNETRERRVRKVVCTTLAKNVNTLLLEILTHLLIHSIF